MFERNGLIENIVDPLQEQHERWVGQQVIEWYNSQHGTSFVFHQRCGVAPDLEYRDGSKLLRVEVVTAYYDTEDAKFRWLTARKRNAPTEWFGVDFEKNLVRDINSELVKKCRKSYGPYCSLAVCVLPDLTSADDMECLLKDINVPPNNPFDGIYLCGQFPAPIGSPANRRVWQLA